MEGIPYSDLAVSLEPWLSTRKLMVHDSGDTCNSTILIILCIVLIKTLNFKLFVLRGCVNLRSPSLY